MAVRKSDRLLFRAVVAGTGMLASSWAYGAAVLSDERYSVVPSKTLHLTSSNEQIANSFSDTLLFLQPLQTVPPSEIKGPEIDFRSLASCLHLLPSLQSFSDVGRIAFLLPSPLDHVCSPTFSIRLSVQSTSGKLELPVDASLTLVPGIRDRKSFAEVKSNPPLLQLTNSPTGISDRTRVTLSDGNHQNVLMAPVYSALTATPSDSNELDLADAINAELILSGKMDDGVESNDNEAVAPESPSPKFADAESLHSHLGLLSELAIQDIDERILRRIAGQLSAPTSQTVLPSGYSITLTPRSNPRDNPASIDEVVDATNATPSNEEISAAGGDSTSDHSIGLVDLSGPSSGAGGGSSANLLTSYTPPSPVLSNFLSSTGLSASISSGIRPPALRPISTRSATASTLSSSTVATAYSVALPAPAALVAAADDTGFAALPLGILKYTMADLQPISSVWMSSHAARISGGRLAGLVIDATGNTAHAAIWNLSATGFVDIHPTKGTFINSSVTDISGSQAVGIGSTSRVDHALLWTNANPDNTIDLNPLGYKSSYALATTGSHQIGYGYLNVPVLGEQSHALLWNSSATDYVDLNPVNFIFTYALGGDSAHEVGYGLSVTYNLHALAWAGSALGAIDLHPTSGAFADSRAVTVSGNRAGGYGTDNISGYSHAILWTALDGNSAVDLQPAGFTDSQITATNATTAVGYGRISGDRTGNTHALLWTDGAGGYVDLNTLLPPQYISAEADGIDAAGNIVGWAKDSITGNAHAIEWFAAVPEPTGFVPLAGLASLSVFMRRHRQRRPALPV